MRGHLSVQFGRDAAAAWFGGGDVIPRSLSVPKCHLIGDQFSPDRRVPSAAMDWSTSLDVIRTVALIAAVVFAASDVRR